MPGSRDNQKNLGFLATRCQIARRARCSGGAGQRTQGWPNGFFYWKRSKRLQLSNCGPMAANWWTPNAAPAIGCVSLLIPNNIMHTQSADKPTLCIHNRKHINLTAGLFHHSQRIPQRSSFINHKRCFCHNLIKWNIHRYFF